MTMTACLWFDTQGEDAATFYCSVFPASRIVGVTNWGPENPEREGTALTVDFELDGQKFVALNGGPQFPFTEAVSFQIPCRDQEEVDYYWTGLQADGGRESDCGWLKDRFGMSWQVVPTRLPELLADPDKERANRAMQAMMRMQKLVIADLEKAADG
ncbi:VOC family protein [Lapillicoccus sp.]|uniref:VOC family protein n=1 Tax=Lapillicoccus sp. TaxID=1909287 RepID=UPI0027C504E9|nr:VOC family protein [Actinomycetota bacterium]